MAEYNSFHKETFTDAETLVTVQELKDYLKIDHSAEDNLIQRLVDRATAMIQQDNKRDLLQKVYTDETYNGEGHDMLFIKNFPVQSITSLSIDDQQLQPEDYSLDPSTGIVNGFFPEGWQNIKVTYTGGYPANDPELQPYKNDALFLAADLYEGRWKR